MVDESNVVEAGSISHPHFWRTYFTLSFVIFSGFVALASAGPFQNLYAVSLGASLSGVALISGVNTTVALFAGLWWGNIADDPARRKWMMIGSLGALAVIHVAVAAVSLVPQGLLLGWASPWLMLVPLRLLEGIVYPANAVATMAMMGELLAGNARRPSLVSAYRMSGSLAFGIAIMVSGSIAERVGYTGSYLMAGGVFVLAMGAAISLPGTVATLGRIAARGAQRIPFGDLAAGPMRPVLLLAVAFGLPFTVINSVWPLWIANTLGLGQAIYSRLWGLAAFVEVPCMILAGALISRIGAARTFMAGLIGFALVFVIYAVEPPLEGLVGAQLIRGVAYALYTATSLTLAIELAPPLARGRAAGLYQSAQGLAQIVGTWIGPPLTGAVGFTYLYLLAASAVLGGAGYAFRLSQHAPRTPVVSDAVA